jgi:hypothetical protein
MRRTDHTLTCGPWLPTQPLLSFLPFSVSSKAFTGRERKTIQTDTFCLPSSCLRSGGAPATSTDIACYLDRNNKMAVRRVSNMRRTTISLIVILFTVPIPCSLLACRRVSRPVCGLITGFPIPRLGSRCLDVFTGRQGRQPMGAAAPLPAPYRASIKQEPADCSNRGHEFCPYSCEIFVQCRNRRRQCKKAILHQHGAAYLECRNPANRHASFGCRRAFIGDAMLQSGPYERPGEPGSLRR